MIAKLLVSAAVVLTLSAGGLALAQTAQMDRGAMEKMMQQMMPSANDSASTKDFKQASMRMMERMHVPFSGAADMDFARQMVAHHQGAIDMAKVELQHGKNPELRGMAEKIIRDQTQEIAQLEEWIKKADK